MKKLSRRDFLKLSLTGAGTVLAGRFISACGGNPTAPAEPTAAASLPPTAPAATTAATSLPSSSPAEPTPSPEPSATTFIPPDLVVVRGGEPEELVRSALAALGGMERFVKPGMNVVVKPNACVGMRTYEFAATTNPWVMGAIVKMCFEAGAASVKTFDFPFNGSETQAFSKSGISDEVTAAGAEIVSMPGFKFVETEIPMGTYLKKAKIFDEVLNADVFINVPIAKHHGEAGLTLGMKNLMGAVLDRGTMHRALGQCIADLNSVAHPHLTIIDAVRILTKNGPSGGTIKDAKKMDTLIAGTDIVAADCYAALNLFNIQPMDLAYIAAASEMGLGRTDLENLNIREISLG